MKRKIILLFLFPLLICACDKADEEVSDQLTFTSLVSEKDTIAPGESTKITATASGSQLEFYWSATKGDILGSGAQIIYTGSPCIIGTNQITCKVTNGNNQSETKTIDIIVVE